MNGQSILVTGGTGSFGTAFVKHVLTHWPDIRRLVVFSRDELKQFDMSMIYGTKNFPAMRYFLGDVRDRDRLRRALDGIDIVVHAAALKQVPAAEYNPFEVIKTNVIGAENLIEACLDTGVKRVVALSTDKAASPINLYGASKLASDKLFVAANNIRGHRDIRFAVVRYGNVMGSRGSVIPYFLKMRETGVLPITDPEMTRFNITLQHGIAMVLGAIENAIGGEIFVPKVASYRITDLAHAIAPGCKHQVIGIRPGEKLHEDLITASDSLNTLDMGDHFVIMPMLDKGDQRQQSLDQLNSQAKPVQKGFCYNSGTNREFLSIDQLRALIREHVDSTFSV